jgi:hypothetical protein
MTHTTLEALKRAGTPLGERPMSEGHEHCDDYDDGHCGNCGDEGFVYGCSWDWQCDTWDEGEGICLCTRPCEWCNAPKLTTEQIADRLALRQVLGEALSNPSAQDA